ncbi:DNA polymerase Ligase (LigD) [uncultured archaeon]|nr:DNA polymerase Ligase (LigD) [uncultured archaeon]
MARFVVHQHKATHLHWDFRLDIGGTLKSWAVPKEPPKERGVKRLAVQVEDHPRSYIGFEGEIKEGYGKGTVKIWDKGPYRMIDRKPEKIVVELNGSKLRGKYVLVKMKPRFDFLRPINKYNPFIRKQPKQKVNWLLMKI